MSDDATPQMGKVLRDYPANLGGMQDPVAPQSPMPKGVQVAYTPPPEIPPANPSFAVNGRPQEDDQRKPFKPFPFALKKNEGGGFRIWPGRLFSSINQLSFAADGTYQDQAGIDIPSVHYPGNMDAGPDHESTELAWNGNVYAYWETDGAGVPDLFEIRGPGTPATNSLPLDGASGDKGKFYIQIGTVPAGAGDITQILGSDIHWGGAFVEQDSGSSGLGSGPIDPPGGSSGGSDKSTAIVPAPWSPTGYVALFIAEMPEVRFDDVVTFAVRGRRQSVALDHRFLAVCEKDSIVLCGSGTDNGRAARVWLAGKQLNVEVSRLPWLRPGQISVRLSGIRKGFAGKRFPNRTHKQFEANEAFINSAYPGSP
jgi:hypothetical protein